MEEEGGTRPSSGPCGEYEVVPQMNQRSRVGLCVLSSRDGSLRNLPQEGREHYGPDGTLKHQLSFSR